MHLLKLILLLTILFFFMGVTTADISISGADAIFNISAVSVNISTPETAYSSIYVTGADSVYNSSLDYVNINTSETAYSSIYVTGADSLTTNGLLMAVVQFDHIGNKTVNETEQLQFTILASDLNGNAVTYSVSGLPSGATFDAVTATFNWTPTFEQAGVYNVTFNATANGASDSETVNITVNNVDRAPILDLIGNKFVNENESLRFNVSATDLDGDAITYSATGLPTGATLNATSGKFNWTPTFEQAGVYNVTFNATANGLSDSETVNITVNNVDRAPVLAPIGAKSVNETELLEFNISATDADNDSIVYSALNLPNGATFDASTATFNWTPTFDQAGVYNVTFNATANGLSDSETVNITVNNVDRAPVLVPIGAKSVNESELLEFNISAIDADNDTITYSATGLPVGATLNPATGKFNWTPTFDQAGLYNVTFNATANGASDSEIVNITVNNVDRAPELAPIGSKSINETELLQFNISATDPDGDSITYSASGLPVGATLNPTSGKFNWTPTFDQAGVYNVTFNVTTANGAFDSETVNITVNNVDRAPILAPIGSKSVNETEFLKFNISATDPDDDPITYSATGLPAGATFDATTATFNWTPTFDQAGVYKVTFNATSNGASDSETVNITVNNVDRAPVLVPIGAKSVNESELLEFNISATDADNDTITYSASGLPAGATFDAATATFNWTPTFDQEGVYNVTFNSTAGGLSDSETVNITVNNVDRAPVLAPIGPKSVNETELLKFNISATDADNDTITYSASGLPVGATLNPTSGKFNWTPTFDQAGVYSVTFNATANGASDSETVNITVNNMDRAPVLASIGGKSVNETELLKFNISATDADNDTITYSASGLPAGATFDAATATFNWTPTFDQEGVYNVTFNSTAGGLSDSETVNITVNNVDRAPVLAPIGSKSVNENELLTFNISATDADGDSIIYSASGLPAGATFDAATATFNWTPAFDQAGVYNVTFNATANGLADSETVTITVVNVDSAPVLAAIGSKSVNENELLAFNVSATDAEGDAITYSASGLPTGVTLNPTTGKFNWTPTFDQAGVYDVTFNATSNGLSDSETVNITVNNVDRAPVLAPIGSKSVNETELLEFKISATDSDNDTIIYSASGLPAGATFDAATATFNWTPGNDDEGTYNVTFNATSNGLTDSETVTITVGNVDRAPMLAAIGSKSVNENELLQFNISATDPDGDLVIYSATGLPTGATFDATTATFNWTSGFDQAGVYNVTFNATANGLTDSEIVTITVVNVDSAPEIAAIGSKSVNENELLTFNISATDDEGDLITYSVSGLPAGATFNATTAIFSWTPGSDDEGTYNIIFNATANGLTDSETVTITVGNVDRAPVLAAIGSKSVDENELLTFNISATDSDGDLITYSVSGLPAGATFDVTTAIFSWTPGYDQEGEYNVTFIATANGQNDSESIIISVAANDPAPTYTYKYSYPNNNEFAECGYDVILKITSSASDGASMRVNWTYNGNVSKSDYVSKEPGNNYTSIYKLPAESGGEWFVYITEYDAAGIQISIDGQNDSFDVTCAVPEFILGSFISLLIVGALYMAMRRNMVGFLNGKR